MNPARWHSLRTNKKWRILTATGTAIILACWIHSLFFYSYIAGPLRSESFSCGTSKSFVFLATGPSYYQPYLHAGVTQSDKSEVLHPEGSGELLGVLLPVPRMTSYSDLVSVIIPYWLILLTFLGIQYLLLPKSLPPPKIAPHPAPPATP